jgi:hypothetical protein
MGSQRRNPWEGLSGLLEFAWFKLYLQTSVLMLIEAMAEAMGTRWVNNCSGRKTPGRTISISRGRYLQWWQLPERILMFLFIAWSGKDFSCGGYSPMIESVPALATEASDRSSA